MKPSNIAVVIIALASMMSFSLSAADSDAGKTKSALCAGCHGVDGNSSNATWPSLAGQNANYLVKQIKEFKSGARVDPTMQAMVAALGDEDIKDIAAYFESQKSKPVAFDDKLLSRGEDIFRGGISDAGVPACMGCHSPGGGGNAPAGFPSLKSQHVDYTVAQLKKFRDGTRSNDVGNMMRNVAARMSDQEMTSVAAYIAGLQ